MRHNEHFREFFVNHEKSLQVGLAKLDKASNKKDYFTKKVIS